jgi:hypothetical protein
MNCKKRKPKKEKKIASRSFSWATKKLIPPKDCENRPNPNFTFPVADTI